MTVYIVPLNMYFIRRLVIGGPSVLNKCRNTILYFIVVRRIERYLKGLQTLLAICVFCGFLICLSFFPIDVENLINFDISSGVNLSKTILSSSEKRSTLKRKVLGKTKMLCRRLWLSRHYNGVFRLHLLSTQKPLMTATDGVCHIYSK